MPKRKLDSGTIDKDVIKKFKQNIEPKCCKDNGHWVFPDYKDNRASIDGSLYSLSRLMWACHKDNDLNNIRLKRTCDNTKCFNPDHFLKTTIHSDRSIKVQKMEETEDDWEAIKMRLKKHSVPDEDHHIWIGSTDKKGYGRTCNRQHWTAAHRLAWEAENRQRVPEGMVIRHKCLRKDCINPQHLEIGTPKENMTDKVRDNTDVKGSKHPHAKIDEEKALAIFKSEGQGTRAQRAERFGVSISIVKEIDSGGSWTSITGKKPRERPSKINKSLSVEDYEKILNKLKEGSKVVESKDFDEPHWLWNGRVDENGYGRVSYGGKTHFTHVVSCEAFNHRPRNKIEGKIELIRHKCQQRSCCSPNHLEFGTAKDNASDRKRDGTALRGENGSGAKISEELARQIKYAPRDGTRKERAEMYGVSYEILGGIEIGRTWKHI